MRPLLACLLFGLSLCSFATGCNGIVKTGDDPYTSESGMPHDSVPCLSQAPENESCTLDGYACFLVVDGCEIDFLCAGGSWKPQASDCTEPCAGQPPQGSACLTAGEGCTVGDECGATQWSCNPDHTWSVTNFDDPCCGGGCDCSQSACPAAPPGDGAACDPCVDASACQFELSTACGMQIVTVSCGPDALWHVPPLQGCGCSEHTTADSCAADPACRFLLSGCDAPSLNDDTCVPKDDCLDVPCAPGQSCTTFNAGECAGAAGCAECHQVNACLP